MKKSKSWAAVCGVVFAGLVTSGLVDTQNARAMQIDNPVMYGKCKGVSGTYTVQFTTGIAETSHTIRVDQALDKDGNPEPMFIEQSTFPHPTAQSGVSKTYAPTPEPNWPDDGHWMAISSSYVMNGDTFMGPTIWCQAN